MKMDYDCKRCINRENEEVCSECSVNDDDYAGCSCHLNPPCNFCVNNLYEEDETVRKD